MFDQLLFKRCEPGLEVSRRSCALPLAVGAAFDERARLATLDDRDPLAVDLHGPGRRLGVDDDALAGAKRWTPLTGTRDQRHRENTDARPNHGLRR